MIFGLEHSTLLYEDDTEYRSFSRFMFQHQSITMQLSESLAHIFYDKLRDVGDESRGREVLL